MTKTVCQVAEYGVIPLATSVWSVKFAFSHLPRRRTLFAFVACAKVQPGEAADTQKYTTERQENDRNQLTELDPTTSKTRLSGLRSGKSGRAANRMISCAFPSPRLTLLLCPSFLFLFAVVLVLCLP